MRAPFESRHAKAPHLGRFSNSGDYNEPLELQWLVGVQESMMHGDRDCDLFLQAVDCPFSVAKRIDEYGGASTGALF
jgi:hypothetical protein